MGWPLQKLQEIIEKKVDERTGPIVDKLNEMLIEVKEMNKHLASINRKIGGSKHEKGGET